MADTTFIKKKIEPYVREWLGKLLPGHTFDELIVDLPSGGTHRFDAVSEDRTIIGNILTNRAHTRTGRENTGAVRKAIADIELLNKLSPGTCLLLIFTAPDFCELMRKRGGRHGIRRIRLLICPLPDDLQAALIEVLTTASQEQRAAGESS